MSSRSDDPLREDPDYSAYSLRQLYDAFRTIDAEKFPERHKKIEVEIRQREEIVQDPDSIPEQRPSKPVGRILWVFAGGVLLVGALAPVNRLLALQLGGAVLPGLLWLVAVYAQDRFEPEPIGEIVKVYLLGAVAVLPVGLVASFIAGPSAGSDAIQGISLASGVLAGPIEESFKLAVVLAFIHRNRNFNEPLDGIVYASTAALGFASAENIGYVMRYGENVVLVRALLSIPGHFLDAGFYGYAIGMRVTRRQARYGLFTGWLLAAAAHSTFNVLASLAPVILVVGFLVLIAMFYRARVRELLAMSPFRPTVPRRLKFCPKCRARLDGVPLQCEHCGFPIPVPAEEAEEPYEATLDEPSSL